MNSYPYSHAILFVAGFISGTLNVVAGGGSFLTLPVLIFLGLPASVANGTNRIGVLTQNVGAVWAFHRLRILDWRSLLWGALPAVIGAGAGTWVALWTSDQMFKRVLAFLMVAVTLWTLWDPFGGKRAPASSPTGFWILCISFFLVGVYSGFVQAGVGFFILAATSFAGLDLVKGNAIKVLVVLATMVISLAIFASHGKVDWSMGLVLGLGNFLGGLLGVRLTILKGHNWIRKVVTVTIIVFALKLWFSD
ncbi:MAG: sulfite exporter TauE/SafE family protein [Acidobacteriota bacterium]